MNNEYKQSRRAHHLRKTVKVNGLVFSLLSSVAVHAAVLSGFCVLLGVREINRLNEEYASADPVVAYSNDFQFMSQAEIAELTHRKPPVTVVNTENIEDAPPVAVDKPETVQQKDVNIEPVTPEPQNVTNAPVIDQPDESNKPVDLDVKKEPAPIAPKPVKPVVAVVDNQEPVTKPETAPPPTQVTPQIIEKPTPVVEEVVPAEQQPEQVAEQPMAMVKKVGARILNLPQPRYPTLSRRKGEQGLVVLSVEVLHDGSVGDVSVLKSPGFSRLESAAIKAVKAATFQPGTEDGNGVKSVIEVPVRFVLKQ